MHREQCNVKSMSFLLECPTQAPIQRLWERTSIETNYQAWRKENYVLKCWEQTKIFIKNKTKNNTPTSPPPHPPRPLTNPAWHKYGLTLIVAFAFHIGQHWFSLTQTSTGVSESAVEPVSRNMRKGNHCYCHRRCLGLFVFLSFSVKSSLLLSRMSLPFFFFSFNLKGNHCCCHLGSWNYKANQYCSR